jgi:hypothetical protein
MSKATLLGAKVKSGANRQTVEKYQIIQMNG